MKILITQLTRFGDILYTLPVISSVRRKYPEAEIHFLVRSRFAAAAKLSPHVNKVWEWPSDKIVGPFFDEHKSKAIKYGEATQAMRTIITALKGEGFEYIYNLSFTPSSSFITHMVSCPESIVLGYTRTSDFFLHITDEASRYFRAQVGVEKNNRLHLNDIFAMITSTDLSETDLRSLRKDLGDKEGIVCHLGASQAQKAWTEPSWYGLLRKLTTQLKMPITLVGSKDEFEFADRLCKQIDEPQYLINKVGSTNFEELAGEIAKARLFVGADSSPMQMASLVGCPVLNLSLGPVRFWETGPTVPGSRILVRSQGDLLTSDEVFSHLQEMLGGKPAHEGCVECVDMPGIRYFAHPKSQVPWDEWDMVWHVYFNGPLPELNEEVRVALAQVVDVASLAIEMVDTLEKNPNRTETVGVLDRIDEILKVMESGFPALRPLLWRFVVDRENNPPGERAEVFAYSKRVYSELLEAAQKLVSDVKPMESQL